MKKKNRNHRKKLKLGKDTLRKLRDEEMNFAGATGLSVTCVCHTDYCYDV